MLNEAEIGAKLVAVNIQNDFNILQEVANRAEVRTMDRTVQTAALFPYIDEKLGIDDIAIIDLTGNAWHIKGGQTVNLSQREYVQKALAGQTSISDIIPAAASAVNTGYPLLNLTVPIKMNNTVIGAILARTNAFRLTDIVKDLKIRGNGYAYMCNTQGQLIAHATRRESVSRLETPREIAKTNPEYKPVADAIQYVLEHKEGSTGYIFNGKLLLCGFAPVPGFDMFLILTAEQRSLMGDVIFLRNLMIIIVAVFVGISIGLSFWIAHSIASPLSFIRKAVRQFGEGDLTQQAAVPTKDEIGEIGNSLNQSMHNVRCLVETIKETTIGLSGIGGELAANMLQTATAINEITANIQSIRERSLYQSASVTENNATMEQMNRNFAQFSEHVEKQNESVAKSTAAIEEMLVNIQNVTGTLVKNIENVERLAKASDAGRNGIQEAAMDIQEIARESEGLLEINAVMENIAGQTNLLSMNAAIEAAHAGDVGKGFAVVADEIRKLAESSSEQSKTIAAILQKIKSSIDKITASINEVINKFEAIDNGVKTVFQQEEHIRSSMEEQSAGSKQILEAISRLNELTGLVSSGSVEMREASQQVMQESRRLEQATAEITNGVNEMANGTNQINLAVNRVNEMTGQNKETIDMLVEEVEKFRVD
jgi:methyl-accepting chemotaxis protein